jgi:hypothetical protein
MPGSAVPLALLALALLPASIAAAGSGDQGLSVYEERVLGFDGLRVSVAYSGGLVLGLEAHLKYVGDRPYPVVEVNASECLSLAQLYRNGGNFTGVSMLDSVIEAEPLGSGYCRVRLDLSAHPSLWFYLEEGVAIRVVLRGPSGGLLSMVLSLGDYPATGARGAGPGGAERVPGEGPGGGEPTGPGEPLILGEPGGGGGFRFPDITFIVLAFLVAVSMVVDLVRGSRRGR